MTDDELLLASVIASPKDDLPRLVYADWLDETGRPLNVARAEFIRVQCELNRCEPDRERLAQLLIREKTLLSLYGPAWLEPLRRKGEPLFSTRSHGLFRRGFVEVVWMPAGWFLWKSELLFRRAPVTEVRITLSTP